jgi:hypothetical protein
MKKTLILIILTVLFVSCAGTDVSFITSKKNPHRTDTDCLACHDKQPKEGAVTFLNDDGFVKVCISCHDTSVSHLVNIKVPDWMEECVPQGFKLKNGDTLACITCHDLTDHMKKSAPKKDNPYFLRGGPYEDRSGICLTCHDTNKCNPGCSSNPHKQLDMDGEIIESRCLFCHTEIPYTEVSGIRPGMFKGDPSTFCYGCHAKKEEGHPAKVTHHDKVPSEKRINCIKKANSVENGTVLPLLEGKVFCGTCHNPHEKGVLKGAANKGAGEPFMLRLKEDDICSACHCD